MTLRVAVTGASGRMGQAVARAVIADDTAELVAFVARPGSMRVRITTSQEAYGHQTGVARRPSDTKQHR
jgi:dihydrodipicolinate reductase